MSNIANKNQFECLQENQIQNKEQNKKLSPAKDLDMGKVDEKQVEIKDQQKGPGGVSWELDFKEDKPANAEPPKLSSPVKSHIHKEAPKEAKEKKEKIPKQNKLPKDENKNQDLLNKENKDNKPIVQEKQNQGSSSQNLQNQDQRDKQATTNLKDVQLNATK